MNILNYATNLTPLRNEKQGNPKRPVNKALTPRYINNSGMKEHHINRDVPYFPAYREF